MPLPLPSFKFTSVLISEVAFLFPYFLSKAYLLLGSENHLGERYHTFSKTESISLFPQKSPYLLKKNNLTRGLRALHELPNSSSSKIIAFHSFHQALYLGRPGIISIPQLPTISLPEISM